MSISPGMRLGPYEVVAALGAGGMGEVFRARDLRLGRDVALKVLGERFMLEPQRVARFERETRVLASLNHPNIATLHGVEQIDRTHALVMELVEGETLAERLAHGPMPLRETLDIAEQIAAALEAAHEHGVVHRDLKPANVKVRPDGTVKLLDFGLAKAFGQALVASEPGEATATSLDAAGAILGTPGYMSPEQARALPIDKRTDVWAFGCVLFEMLTGQRAFDGERTSDVIAKVIEREPDYGAIPAATPRRLVRLLRRMLAKDPRQRLRDCGDARLELQELGSSDADADGLRAPARRRAPWVALGALGGAVAVAAVAIAGWFDRPVSRQVTRFSIVLPSSQVLQGGAYQSIAISPAATDLAYIADNRVYVRALSELDARPLAGTDDQGEVGGVIFSPDGQWLAFYSPRYKELRKVPLAGGQPVRIAAVESYLGGSWGSDDRIVFAQTGGVFAVPGAGGPAVLLLAVDRERGELALNPMTLPGGRDVLFTLVTSGANGNERVGRSVVVQTLGSSERRVAIEGGRDARYVARTGQLVYDDSGALMTVTFDAVRGRPTAAPQPVVPSVAHHPVNDSSNFAVAREGTLVYQPVTFPSTTLTWVDRDGRREPLGAPAQPYEYFRVSPDGTKIVTATRDQGQEIYVWDIASSSFTRITFNPEYDGYAIWTPDSKRIVFQSMAGGQQTIARKAIDGTGSTERLLAGGTDLVPPNSITADGSELIFRRIAPGATSELWSLPLDRAAAAKPLLVMEHDQQMNGEVSPDGRWLVYQSNESGRFEIYLRPFPEVDGGRWQVSSDGGFQPTWTRDGRALLYLTGSRLVEVEVSGGATPVIGAVHVALASIGSKPYDRSGRTYDVAPDGRLLVSEPLTAGPVTFDVVLSWDRAQR